MIKVYFNELSACGSVDEANVKQTIEDLLLCLKHLHNHNVDLVIVDGAIGQYLISNTRSIYQILGDKSLLDNDSSTYLMECFQEDYQLQEEIEDYEIVSAKCGGQEAVGLTLASDFLNKGVALSLSHAGWDKNVYNLQIEVLSENGEVFEQETTAKNASTETILETYNELFPVIPIQVPETGKLLYIELSNFFPNLIFSTDAKNFIKRCQSKAIITQVFWKLYDLNEVAGTFRGKPFEKGLFSSKASPESGSRDNMSELDVKFEDSIVRHCSWHLRYTPGAGRIHFSSEVGDGKTIYVGYVGSKINP